MQGRLLVPVSFPAMLGAEETTTPERTPMSTAERIDNDPGHRPLTSELSQWLAGFSADALTPAATTWAKHALLDWFAVTIAAQDEPLVKILTEEYAGRGGTHVVVGQNASAHIENAVLINGAASHALDYDDVNRRLNGHPTVPVAPVVLALAEASGASGRDVIAGLVAGTEIECLVGQMAGPGHYERGFHNTATIGTFGATGGAAQMLGLDTSQCRFALGIAASEAAGLKSNFGTMTKPLHAGKAAMNGLMAARLAARGFTSNDNIFECPMGVADVLMPGFTAGATQPSPPGYYAIEQTLFKYHAACYLTHAGIEAIKKIRAEHGIDLADLAAMELHINPGLLTVCCIPTPRTGLEIKFSIRHCAAMALDGIATGALSSYSDANATDARLGAAREKVELKLTDSMDRMATRVVIRTNDGRTLEAYHDAGIHEADVTAQGRKLREKFDALVPSVIGDARAAEIAGLIETLETQPNVTALLKAAR